MDSEFSLIAINQVIADRAQDFETFFTIVVQPAVAQYRPHLKDRAAFYRAAQVEDGVVTYVFLFRGGSLQEWSIEEILAEAMGKVAAAREMEGLSQMMAKEQYALRLETLTL